MMMSECLGNHIGSIQQGTVRAIPLGAAPELATCEAPLLQLPPWIHTIHKSANVQDILYLTIPLGLLKRAQLYFFRPHINRRAI